MRNGQIARLRHQPGFCQYGLPFQDFERAILVLGNRRAALHKITRVDVEHAADLANGGMMNVATHNTIDARALGFLR